jgi:hypothetical protein
MCWITAYKQPKWRSQLSGQHFCCILCRSQIQTRVQRWDILGILWVNSVPPSKSWDITCTWIKAACYLSHLLQFRSHLSSNDWLLSHLFHFHINKIIPWLLSLTYAPIQYSLNMPWLLVVTTAPIQYSLNMPWLLLVTTTPIQYSLTFHTIIQHYTAEIYWWPC